MPLGAPPFSIAASVACAAGFAVMPLVFGEPVFMERAGMASPRTTAAPRAAAITGRRTTSRPKRSQNALDVVEPRRTRSRSRRGPMVESSTGSRLIAAAIEISGTSMPPMPTLRRKGTGSTIRESRPTATVSPLKMTALPAEPPAATIAASLSRPRSRSSRHLVTTISE